MRANYRLRRIICALISAEFGIISGEKILVEVKPRITSFRELARINSPYYTFKQINCECYFPTRFRLRENSQCLRKQTVAAVERAGSGIGCQMRFAVQPREEESICKGLRVGVSEPRVVGIGK